MTGGAQQPPLGQPVRNMPDEALPEPKVGHAFDFEDHSGGTSLEVEGSGMVEGPADVGV